MVFSSAGIPCWSSEEFFEFLLVKNYRQFGVFFKEGSAMAFLFIPSNR
jgi:hypothetical protein